MVRNADDIALVASKQTLDDPGNIDDYTLAIVRDFSHDIVLDTHCVYFDILQLLG